MPGSITRQGKNSWRIRYELPRDPVTGKRRQGSETVRGTRKDAERRLMEILLQLDRGVYVEPSRVTVREYMEDFLAKYEAEHPVKKTAENARYLLTKHVINHFGDMPLARLTSYHIDRLYTKMRQGKARGGKGLSARTVRYVHTLLAAALNRAVDLNLIPYNPALKVKPPPLKKRKRVDPLTDEEKARFLEAIKGDRYENLFIVALGTGMRLGELLSLTWDQVDFAAGFITVVKKGPGTPGTDLTEGKTESSKRTIPIFPDVRRALKDQRARQAEQKLYLGPLYEDHGLVFPNQLGKPENPSNVRNRHFKPALERAGLPRDTHFHALRHTFATSLLRQGVDVKKVSAWLGHADAGFTYRVYHHYIPEKIDQKEAERLNAYLFGGSSKKKTR
jgi:integrase